MARYPTRQGYPYPPPYVPQGTGLEPSPQRGPLDLPGGWRRLWDRIPGEYATKTLAIFQLMRRSNRDPDTIIARWVANSAIVPSAGPGNSQLLFNFDTLSVINGIRALVGGDGAVSAFDYTVSLRAGSDGGYVFGSDQNPSSLTAVSNGGSRAEHEPIPMTPVSAAPNNDWTGTLTGALGIDPQPVHITLYGVSLWDPNGQIQ
jgi:hypothetical protein